MLDVIDQQIPNILNVIGTLLIMSTQKIKSLPQNRPLFQMLLRRWKFSKHPSTFNLKSSSEAWIDNGTHDAQPVVQLAHHLQQIDQGSSSTVHISNSMLPCCGKSSDYSNTHNQAILAAETTFAQDHFILMRRNTFCGSKCGAKNQQRELLSPSVVD